MANYKSSYTGQQIDAGIAKANTALQEEQYTGTYSKPSGGIPKSDLASSVQTSLGKADTAIQDISGKQDTLVSGTNIKTINNTSILGSGNITIEGGGGSGLPISFSSTQPPTDGSVILWINANAEEPVGDEITGFNLSGNCTNIEIEDQTELYSRQYQVTATGEYSGYNILGLKKGGVGLNKIEVAPSSLNYDLVTVGYDPNASGANDFSSLILFSITGFKQGFKVKKDGSATEGVNPTVTGTYSNASDPYILESKVVGTSLVLTATKVSSGEQEVQYEWTGLGSTFVPCFGVGANKAGALSMTFKKVV